MNEELINQILDIVKKYYMPKPQISRDNNILDEMAAIEVPKPKLTEREAEHMMNMAAVKYNRECILENWQAEGYVEMPKSKLEIAENMYNDLGKNTPTIEFFDLIDLQREIIDELKGKDK